MDQMPTPKYVEGQTVYYASGTWAADKCECCGAFKTTGTWSESEAYALVVMGVRISHLSDRGFVVEYLMNEGREFWLKEGEISDDPDVAVKLWRERQKLMDEVHERQASLYGGG